MPARNFMTIQIYALKHTCSSKGPLKTALSVQRSEGYAMLMSLNKGETAVHGDSVRKHKVLTIIPWSWYVSSTA